MPARCQLSCLLGVESGFASGCTTGYRSVVTDYWLLGCCGWHETFVDARRAGTCRLTFELGFWSQLEPERTTVLTVCVCVCVFSLAMADEIYLVTICTCWIYGAILRAGLECWPACVICLPCSQSPKQLISGNSPPPYSLSLLIRCLPARVSLLRW